MTQFMASKIEIANMALDLIGQPIAISTLQDQTPQGRQVLKHIDQAILEVLAEGLWHCAQDRAILPQLTASPLFGWAYQYQLPQDYVRMVRFNETDTADVTLYPYKIEGGKLLTDQTSASIIYVANLGSTSRSTGSASPLLTECFALRLAAKLAWPMQQSATLRAQLIQEYQTKLRRALAQDAKEGRALVVNRLSDSAWLKNRAVSTNG